VIQDENANPTARQACTAVAPLDSVVWSQLDCHPLLVVPVGLVAMGLRQGLHNVAVTAAASNLHELVREFVALQCSGWKMRRKHRPALLDGS
jgi:hypothetical protein